MRLHQEEATEHFEIPMVWEVVQNLRRTVVERLAAHDRAIRDATAIVVSEFAENVLKYSDRESARESDLTVHVHSDRIVVRSGNPVSSADDAAQVIRIVQDLHAHDDPEALYAQVMEASLEVVASGISRQGLYRIAVVAGFKLHAELDDGWLTITAERSLI